MSIKNFIPQVWSARLLEHLDNAHVYANAVNRNYEGDIKNYGDTVKINQIGDIKISDYSKESEMEAAADLTGTQTTLEINQAKSFNFKIEDIDKAQAHPALMNEAMQRTAYALNQESDKFIAGLYKDADAGNQLGNDRTPLVIDNSTKDKTAYDALVDLAIKLDEANCPEIGRFCIVPPWFHGLLRKDDRFVHATPTGDLVLKNGIIGEAAGFTVYKSNNVPNTTGKKFKIMAGHNMAITYAEQIVQVEAYRPERKFADAVKGLHVYGAKCTQPKALAVLTANKTAEE